MSDATINWADLLRGRFIVFEGPDGAGKSTQFRRFADFVQAQGLEICEAREPGGTPIGEQIRNVLLDPKNEGMDLHCEMLLYMASRAQLVAQRIGPAADAGKVVLADRFISSTMAYQGTAGGLNVADIRAVGKIAMGNHWPDLVIVFDVDERTAAARLSPLLDRMELKGSEFHRTVRQGYRQQVADDPEHHLLIDAAHDIDDVFDDLMRQLPARLESLAR